MSLRWVRLPEPPLQVFSPLMLPSLLFALSQACWSNRTVVSLLGTLHVWVHLQMLKKLLHVHLMHLMKILVAITFLMLVMQLLA